MYPDPARLETPVVTAENRALLEREILRACDGLDGVEDGVLGDPHRGHGGLDSVVDIMKAKGSVAS